MTALRRDLPTNLIVRTRMKLQPYRRPLYGIFLSRNHDDGDVVCTVSFTIGVCVCVCGIRGGRNAYVVRKTVWELYFVLIVHARLPLNQSRPYFFCSRTNNAYRAIYRPFSNIVLTINLRRPKIVNSPPITFLSFIFFNFAYTLRTIRTFATNDNSFARRTRYCSG